MHLRVLLQALAVLPVSILALTPASETSNKTRLTAAMQPKTKQRIVYCLRTYRGSLSHASSRSTGESRLLTVTVRCRQTQDSLNSLPAGDNGQQQALEGCAHTVDALVPDAVLAVALQPEVATALFSQSEEHADKGTQAHCVQVTLPSSGPLKEAHIKRLLMSQTQFGVYPCNPRWRQHTSHNHNNMQTKTPKPIACR